VLYQTLARLGQRITALAAETAGLEKQITAIVDDLAPGLIAAEPGIGALSAAQILLSRSHAGRIRSEAAFAMLSGTAPVPVSCGRTDRHRLNRPGDRQLNRAPHIIAINRMRSHPPTHAYVQRRLAEGKTERDIRRCIKRYLIRHLTGNSTSHPHQIDKHRSVISHGDARSLTVSRGDVPAQVGPVLRSHRSDSQADSADSIPVTRSF
jgi:transposase